MYDSNTECKQYDKNTMAKYSNVTPGSCNSVKIVKQTVEPLETAAHVSHYRSVNSWQWTCAMHEVCYTS